MSAQVLVEGDDPQVDVRARFLQVVRRQALDAAGDPVDEVAGHLTWEEATERELEAGTFEIAGGEELEEVEGGVLRRIWHALSGSADVTSVEIEPGLRKVNVRIANTTEWSGDDRQEALQHSLCSTHAVLRVEGGAFVSPLDEASKALENEGLWPCLVGEPPDRSTIIASPIILEEYPRIAPESPGDLFDGGEIDQLLTLSILGMTDEEKAEMRASDPRVRAILERTEAMTADDLMRLHGTWRR